MDFLRSRSLFACGLVEDGDLIKVAILVLRDTHTPGTVTAYIDGREDRAIALEVAQGAGFYTDAVIRRGAAVVSASDDTP